MFDPEVLKDAARCSMFMQRCKLAYWKQNKDKPCVMEADLDEILLIAWKEL